MTSMSSRPTFRSTSTRTRPSWPPAASTTTRRYSTTSTTGRSPTTIRPTRSWWRPPCRYAPACWSCSARRTSAASTPQDQSKSQELLARRTRDGLFLLFKTILTVILNLFQDLQITIATRRCRNKFGITV